MTTAARHTDSATFALHGVRCAGCVLKIERTLAALPGVKFARGNATQKRLRLTWDDAQQDASSIAAAIKALGYDAAAITTDASSPKEQSLLPRLAAAAAGTMNVMAFSISVWAGLATDMGDNTMLYMHVLSGIIALPVVLYSGAVFHRPALRALRAGHMTMDTPITLAIWVTFAASVFETWRGSEHVYFDAVVSLIFFLLIGRVLEQSLRRRSGDSAGNLRELMRVPAHLVSADGTVRDVTADDLSSGDRVLIYSGERVPADGVLRTAHAEVDESVITGETLPRATQKGDRLVAGSILLAGPAEMDITHVGDDAQIGQVAQMIDDVTAHKGEMQKLSDRFAKGYIPLVLGGGGLGFTLWYFFLGASFADALMIAVAVLVVTCPCAAGLATPAVTARAVNLLLKSGIVVRSGEALERLGAVDAVVLDKTGTASLPHPVSTNELPESLRAEIIGLAGSSRHPLARCLVSGREIEPLSGVVEHPGLGVEAPNGARLGSAKFVGLQNTSRNYPVIWYRKAEGHVHECAFHEAAREDLADTLQTLAEMDIEVSLLSGDSATAVDKFARTTNIQNWAADQSPTDKLAWVQKIESAGRNPLMVGDGINDSAALSSAYVSATFAEATQIAQVASDIVLTQARLHRLPMAISTARHARRLIVQNLTFSTIYNVVTVPLALAGFLSPLIAATLMSSSSMLVLANGLRLKVNS